MKKITTLFLALSSVALVHAQSGSDVRRIILGDGNGNNTSVSTGSQADRQAEIDKINKDADAMIVMIRRMKISREEQDRRIAEVERTRRSKIDEVNRKYGYSSGSNGSSGGNGTTAGEVKYKKKHKKDKDDDDDDRYEERKDKGKHLGWEKGVGNPHKNGGKPGKKKS